MADTTQQLPEHPGLRIKVYRVNPKTLVRSRPVEWVARPSKTAMVSHAYPPCECPRCEPPRGGKR